MHFVSFIVAVIVLGLFRFGTADDSCPDFITCETPEKQDTCPEGQFYKEKVKIHGCCSGCVISKDKGQPCHTSADCMPGLKCEKFCIKDDDQACGFYKYYDFTLGKTKYWNPSCLPDGSYAPKQCKGEKMAGKCYCVNKMGKRIFGEEDWDNAESMTCACSRKMDETRQEGLIPYYHCDKRGNFESFQCDDQLCWCATPNTGIPYTNMIYVIDNPNIVGAQYHRQCESVNHVLEKVKNLLRNHGTDATVAALLNCNFDGSYHRVQNVKGLKRCVFVDNAPLTEAQTKDVSCNCAYDRHVAKLGQMSFMAECETNGDYKRIQRWSGKDFCVDEDGFYFSDDLSDC